MISLFVHYDKRYSELNIYNIPTEPCWIVYAPWLDGHDGTVLRSSRIIMVSKATGKVVYDGSANDEG